MTTIEKEKKAKEKNQDTIPINPEILEMVSFDVDFEITPKKVYEIEVEIGKITKNELNLPSFQKSHRERSLT
jgi:hypothetical protein